MTLALTKYNRRSGKYFLYKSGRTVYAKGGMTPNHAKLGDGADGRHGHRDRLPVQVAQVGQGEERACGP